MGSFFAHAEKNEDLNKKRKMTNVMKLKFTI